MVHELKRPFRDATTECLFEPLDFLARLAALVLRPRSHLIRYHAVLAPNAHHRRLVVPPPPTPPAPEDEPSPWRARAWRMPQQPAPRPPVGPDSSPCQPPPITRGPPTTIQHPRPASRRSRY